MAGSWLLIQIMETLSTVFALPVDTTRIVVIILAIGLVPVLIFSWTFELTPSGLVRDDSASNDSPDNKNLSSKIDRSIIVLLLLAISYFAVDKFVLDPVRDSGEIAAATEQARNEAILQTSADKSIAVLPFTDLSIERDQAYFSDGIAEELLNVLAKISELRVISRTSSFSFRGDSLHIPTIAKQLNVAHILEGSVRKFGDRIRITAQLIDARTDTHLWSETYDRTLDDVFAIQDEISAMVVEKLKITLLGPKAFVSKTNPETYGLYLQGRHIWANRVQESYSEAEMLLLRALALDPNYVPAISVLANIYLGQSQIRTRDRAEARQLIRELMATAAGINANAREVILWNAWFALRWDDELAKAAELYEQALDMDPADPQALRIVMQLLYALNRGEEAIEIGQFTVGRDPLCLTCYRNLVQAYLRYNRPQDVIDTVMKMRVLGLDSSTIKNVIAEAYLATGQPELALQEYSSIASIYPGLRQRSRGTAMAYHDLGQLEKSSAALEEFISIVGEDGEIYRLAEFYAWTDNPDKAYETIRKMEPGCCVFDGILWRKIRNDAKWPAYFQEYDRLGEDRSAIEFNFSLPENASKDPD